jgi:hypothetical protein
VSFLSLLESSVYVIVLLYPEEKKLDDYWRGPVETGSESMDVDETSFETLNIVIPVQTESPADISLNNEDAMVVDSPDDEDEDAMVVDIVASVQSDAEIGLNEGIGFFKNGENLIIFKSAYP